jgi:hypothetical protein
VEELGYFPFREIVQAINNNAARRTLSQSVQTAIVEEVVAQHERAIGV